MSVNPCRTPNIDLLRDQEVLSWASEEKNLAQWATLAQHTSHFSVLQEPEFVTTWYQNYFDEYAPLILLGHDPQHHLVGLMALAIKRDSGSFHHAGAHLAEYHGWLCHPSYDDEFPLACVLELSILPHIDTWEWRWLPPGSSKRWLSDLRLRKAGISSTVLEQENYIIDLSDSDHLKKKQNRKSLKNYANRLARNADVRLAKLINIADTREMLDTMVPMYDLRMAAIYGNSPVHHDRRRLNFFLDRQRHGDASSVVCLLRNGKPIASNFGAADQDRVLLGLFCFDPLFAQFRPGTVFILQLAEYLGAQGYRVLDLTPGRQSFKKELSSSSELLVMPTLRFSPGARLRGGCQDAMRRAGRLSLQLIGMRTPQQRSNFYARLERKLASVKRRRVREFVEALGRQICTRNEMYYYGVKLNNVDARLPEGISWNEQRLEDFVNLRPGLMDRHERQALARRVLRRAEAGQTAFTVIKNGILAHYGWVEVLGIEKQLTMSDIVLKFPEGSVFLSEFFTDPLYRRQGLYASTILKMLHHSKERERSWAFISVDRRNFGSRRVVERLGFEVYCRVRRWRAFGMSRSNIVSDAGGRMTDPASVVEISTRGPLEMSP